MTSISLLLLLAFIGLTAAHEGPQQAIHVDEHPSPIDQQALLDLVQKHMTALARDLMNQQYGSPPWFQYRDAKQKAEALRQYIAMAANPRSVWHDYYRENEETVWNDHEVAVQELDASRASLQNLYGIIPRRIWPHIIDDRLWNDIENQTLETSCLPENLAPLHTRYNQANLRADAMRRFIAEAIQPDSIWDAYYTKHKTILMNNYVTLVQRRDQLWQLLQRQGREHSSAPISPAPTPATYNPFSENLAPTTTPSLETTDQFSGNNIDEDACEDSDIVCEFLGPNICTEMANYSRESCERTCNHCNSSDSEIPSNNNTEECFSSQRYDFEMWMKVYKAYQTSVRIRYQNSQYLHHGYHSNRLPFHRNHRQFGDYQARASIDRYGEDEEEVEADQQTGYYADMEGAYD